MSNFDEAAALARERELDSTRHFVPVVVPTQNKYEKMARQWEKYLSQFKITPDNCLQPGEQTPSRGRLKAFMEWTIENSEGMFEQKIVEKTLKNKWYCFRSMYQRKTYNVITDEYGKDILYFIKTLYKSTVRRCRKKQIADSLDMQWVLTYLWCYDSYEFRHPRCRVQLTFVSLLLVYTGARPGTIIESSAYRGTNEALRYKDFEMIGLPTETGAIELQLKVRLCFEKGKRDVASDEIDKRHDEDNIFEHKWITLREDRSCRGRCPITYFLCLAFADNAFEALSQPQDVMCLRAPPDGSCLPIHIKTSVKNMPIFRMTDHNGKISETRALTHNCLHRDLGAAGQRFGFKDNLKPYDIRRGTANDVDGSSEVSATQYSQLLGHSVKVLGESYVSNISGIDAQNIVNGQELRKDHIRLLRSKRLHLNLKVPMELPYHKNLELFEDPVLQELQAKEDYLLASLTERFRPFKASLGSELRREYQKVTEKRKHCYRRLYDSAYRSFRRNYFHDAGSEEVRRQILQGPTPELASSFTLEESELSSLLTFVYSAYFPKRSFVAQGLFRDCSITQNGLPDHELLEQMKAMCTSDAYVLYYPREVPIEGRCPGCQELLTDLVMKPYQKAEHIHKCVKQKHQDLCDSTFQRCLPSSCLWANCKSELVQKQKYLSDSIGEEHSDPKERQRARNVEAKRLHDKRRRDTKTTLVGNKISSSPHVTTERAKYIQQHLKNHIHHMVNCYWDGCNTYCGSEYELNRHLQNIHQVMNRRSPVEPSFCLEHPEMGWFECEFEWNDHCKTHLQVFAKSCNMSQRYHTMIRALQCPFCLGNCSLSAARRTHQFTLRSVFNRHMDLHFAHVSKTREPIRCPHPFCGSDALFSGVPDLKVHFYDIHKLSEKGFAKSRSKSINKCHRAKKVCRNDEISSSGIAEAARTIDNEDDDSAYGTDDSSESGFDGMFDDLSMCEGSASGEEWEGFSDSVEGGVEDKETVSSDEEELSATGSEDVDSKVNLSASSLYGENVVREIRSKNLYETYRSHPQKRKLRLNS